MLETAARTGTDAATLLLSGNAAMSGGAFDGGEFIPHASVLCTTGGDVIVQLGTSEGQDSESMSGDSESGDAGQGSSLPPRRVPVRLPSW